MNWFKENLKRMMFWKDDPEVPEYEITDCWPDLPPNMPEADSTGSD